MRTTISIWLSKFITKILNITGRDGSVFPGSIVRKIDRNVLSRLKYPESVVVVTGSSGKGSTVSMIAHILENSGKKVVWNKNGSNVGNATLTLLLNNCTSLSHKIKADVLLLEMDERFITDVLPKNKITHIVLTNVTRDQPARNIHPEIIYDKIMESVSSKAHLIINVDDPILNRAKGMHRGKISTYGISMTKYSSVTTPSYAVDAAYCPKCHSKLKYDCYHYGHLGLYACPNCDFERGNPDYEVTKVDLKNATFYIGKNKYSINKKVFFAVYYTLAAYALCDILGLKEEELCDAINVNVIPSKRMKIHMLKDRPIEMLESKNENALSYLQSLNYIKDQTGKKTVIMGFENVSRRYKYNDLSWLWDVNFELLKDDSVDKIFCIGRFKYDVAARLDYAEIDENKIVLVDDIESLLEKVETESTGNIYTMVCFDMTEIITNLLKEKSHEEK